MRIRVLSDIHLEFYTELQSVLNYIEWDKDSENVTLILAGDIGIYKDEEGNVIPLFEDFLRWVGNKYKHVIYVTGNHEYYNMKKRKLTFKKINDELRELFSELLNENITIHFLDKEQLILEGVTFYGCCLFSDLKVAHSGKTNDVKRIASFTILHKEYEKHLKWILQQDFVKNSVVITHYVPFLPSKNSNSAFYSDVIEQLSDIQKKNIDLWVCGHTHDDIIKNESGIEIRSCCIGYPNELDVKRPYLLDLPMKFSLENSENEDDEYWETESEESEDIIIKYPVNTKRDLENEHLISYVGENFIKCMDELNVPYDYIPIAFEKHFEFFKTITDFKRSWGSNYTLENKFGSGDLLAEFAMIIYISEHNLLFDIDIWKQIKENNLKVERLHNFTLSKLIEELEDPVNSIKFGKGQSLYEFVSDYMKLFPGLVMQSERDGSFLYHVIFNILNYKTFDFFKMVCENIHDMKTIFVTDNVSPLLGMIYVLKNNFSGKTLIDDTKDETLFDYIMKIYFGGNFNDGPLMSDYLLVMKCIAYLFSYCDVNLKTSDGLRTMDLYLNVLKTI